MSNEAKQYTVLVLRPDYVADSGQPIDFFMAHVTAMDDEEAAATGQYQAFMADEQDEYSSGEVEDYCVFAMFEGHLRSLI